jgi:UPF0271 protein
VEVDPSPPDDPRRASDPVCPAMEVSVPSEHPTPTDEAVDRRIDLNADVGESFGRWELGSDAELIPIITSVNIACGAHAGDPLVIERTIELALRAGAAIGAHPGFPDRQGFGRRDLAMSPDELEAEVLYQVAAVAGMVAAAGGRLRHVKAHGALYNLAARDRSVATPIARAVHRLSPDLVVVGPPGSALVESARELGLPVAPEGFADRAYESDGSLRSRRLPGAVLGDPAAVAAQAVRLARSGRFATLCIHGDSPDAPRLARAVRDALEGAGFLVASPLTS